MRLFLFLFLAASCLHRTTPFATKTVLVLGKELLEIVQTVVDISELVDVVDTPQDKKLFGKLDGLASGLKELSDQIEQSGQELDMIRRLLQNVGPTVQLKLVWNDIRNKEIFLNRYFNDMERYVMDYEEYENSTLIDFANSVVSSMPNSVPRLIDFIFTKTIEDNFLKLFSQHFQPNSQNFCNGRQSLSQAFHSQLNHLLILNARSYAITQTAYLFKKMFEKGSFTREMNDTLQEFQNRSNKLLNVYQPYMANATLELWKCDPPQHIEGETFVQITNFLHGFILNKINLDPQGSCKSECDTYNYVEKTHCYDNEWCKKETTCPKIVNCRYVDKSMTVYPQDINKTNRRYDHIEFGTGTTYGRKNISSNAWPLETYTTWWLTRCSYCFCLCDEGPKYFSEIFINMRFIRSNIKENKVVTGLRFVKHNGIIHLQIQEGKVMEQGKIEMDTIRWVPTHNYSRTDRNVKEGIDYHVLSWNDKGFELKDIKVENGYVITGVRFIKINHRLQLEALKTLYDVETGNLTVESTHYHEEKNVWFKYKFGKQLKLKNPDIPTHSSSSNVITTNKYVEFTHSDFEKDAGQTTVPFFDTQPVESAVPVPLSGVGVFHRGSDGYGGFIAPRIFTYNFTQHLASVFSVDTSTNLIRESDKLRL